MEPEMPGPGMGLARTDRQWRHWRQWCRWRQWHHWRQWRRCRSDTLSLMLACCDTHIGALATMYIGALATIPRLSYWRQSLHAGTRDLVLGYARDGRGIHNERTRTTAPAIRGNEQARVTWCWDMQGMNRKGGDELKRRGLGQQQRRDCHQRRGLIDSEREDSDRQEPRRTLSWM
jgi:hypothetical protein